MRFFVVSMLAFLLCVPQYVGAQVRGSFEKARRDSIYRAAVSRMTPAQRDSARKAIDDSAARIKQQPSGFVRTTSAPANATAKPAPRSPAVKRDFRIVMPKFSPDMPQTRTEIGLPVLVRPVATKEELVQKIGNGCKSTDFYVTCDQILEMARRSPLGVNTRDLEGLMEYILILETRYCVPGKRATMYRALRDRITKKTRLSDDWNRPCRTPAPGERAEVWLVDSETGIPFISLDCGNVIAFHEPGALQIRYPEPDVPKPVVVPVLTDTAAKVAPSVVAAPVQVAVAPVALTTKPDSAPATVIPVAKKDHRKRNTIIGIGVAAGVACAIWCRGTTTVHKTVYKNGAPVNPPNNVLPPFILRLGEAGGTRR